MTALILKLLNPYMPCRNSTPSPCYSVKRVYTGKFAHRMTRSSNPSLLGSNPGNEIDVRLDAHLHGSRC